MAASITITGVTAFDGDYPLDLEQQFFTHGELHEIKKMTGLRAGEFQEAMEAGDNDLVVAFAVIAIRRSGKLIHPDLLWNAQAGGIMFNAGEEVEGEESLPPTSEPDAPNSSGSDAPSGPSTETPTEVSPVTHLHTGTPGWDTGVTSESVTSTG